MSVAIATQERMMEINDLSVLAETRLFRGFSLSETASFVEHAGGAVQRFERGSIVLFRGDSLRSIGIVLEGELAGLVETSEGQVTVISEMKKGFVFGDVLSGSSGTSPVTLEARDDTRVIWIEFSRILALCCQEKEYGTFLRNFIEEISDKYFALSQRVRILSERKLRNKITVYLSQLRKQQGSDTVMIPQENRFQLADYLGCDRAALSRELGRMSNEGLIILGKNTVTLNKIGEPDEA